MNSLYKFSKYIFILIAVVGLQSCVATKDYQRPEQPNGFLTESFADSLPKQQVAWQEFLTDNYLQQHIQTALQNNNDIRIALQNIEQSKAYLLQGKAAYWPSLNVGANYSHSVNSTNTMMGGLIGERRHIDQYDLTATAGWEPDIWGKITSQKNRAEASFLQTLAAHQAVKTELIAMVASTYFELLALDEQKKIAEKTIINRLQSVETNQALKTSGRVTEVAVKQAEAQWLSAQSLLLDIDNNIKIKENTFNILLGQLPTDVPRTASFVDEIPTDLIYKVPAEYILNRPDVTAAEMAFRGAFEQVNVARTGFFPNISITATGGFQSVDMSKVFDVGSLFGNVLGGLTQPIFNKRQIRTQYEVSLSEQEKALYNYQQTLLLASKEVSDAMDTYQSNDKKLGLKKEEFQAYTDAVEYSEELLNNGLASYIEVLTAKESELAAELSVVNTQLAKQLALIKLYKSLGGGVN